MIQALVAAYPEGAMGGLAVYRSFLLFVVSWLLVVVPIFLQRCLFAHHEWGGTTSIRHVRVCLYLHLDWDLIIGHKYRLTVNN